MSDTAQKIMFDLPKHRSAAIKVIGVGGGGSNAVNYMHDQGILGVDFVICNTDAQALNNSSIPNKVQLGASITEGLGAGANPEVGKQAALESLEEVRNILDTNTKMIFITAGMGGGTGTGAAPIIAGLAKELGILTVGIVTMPFYFEGNRRMEQAELGVQELRMNVDSLIVINNDKLRELYGNLGFKAGFAKADEVLAIAAKGIAEVITNHYKQNIDLRDAKTVLANSGTAIMGSAVAKGENKAQKAIVDALDSPLLNNNKIKGANNVLLLIVSGKEEITIDEIGTINDYIQTEAGYNANIIMGIGEDEELEESIRVTIVATGFHEDEQIHLHEEKKKVHLLEEEVVQKEKTAFEVPAYDHPSSGGHGHHSYKEEPRDTRGVEENPVAIKTQNFQQSLFEEAKEEPAKRVSKNDMLMQRVVHVLEESDRREESAFSNPQVEEDYFTSHSLKIHPEETYNAPTVVFDFPAENTKALENTTYVTEESSINELAEYGLEVTKLSLEEPEASSTDTQKMIEERREKLKMFNYKFKQNLKDIEEAERVPAYKRQGIELNEGEQQGISRLSLDRDIHNELQIRNNNSFLHDNVD